MLWRDVAGNIDGFSPASAMYHADPEDSINGIELGRLVDDCMQVCGLDLETTGLFTVLLSSQDERSEIVNFVWDNQDQLEYFVLQSSEIFCDADGRWLEYYEFYAQFSDAFCPIGVDLIFALHGSSVNNLHSMAVSIGADISKYIGNAGRTEASSPSYAGGQADSGGTSHQASGAADSGLGSAEQPLGQSDFWALYPDFQTSNGSPSPRPATRTAGPSATAF